MTTETMTPRRPAAEAGRETFWHLVRAELTKFRTVRGWVIAMLIAVIALTAFAFLGNSASQTCSGSSCPAQPTGPGGEPVQDAFYFAHQPLTGNGTITAEMTALTGQSEIGQDSNGQPQMVPDLEAWFMSGIIIKENLTQGSAYAAMMTTGSHGVRMEWNYVNDTPGLTGSVSASSPRWLRLVRTGDTITGYDSADGTHWSLVETASLQGLTSTVQVGFFSAAPNNGAGTLATGVFSHVMLSQPETGWTGTNVGGSDQNGPSLPGSLRQSAGTLSVTGSGAIVPVGGHGVPSLRDALMGTFIALIPLLVVGVMFMTAEYRRGLIRVSLIASPRRGRLLAAKAVVIAGVSFVTGLIAATITIVLGAHILHGSPRWPASGLTEVRLVVGTAALLAVAAVLALALGAILRRSAPALTIAIVLIFIPYLLVGNLEQSSGALGEWLLRITPAAAFSVQQAVPAFSQAPDKYTPIGGYFPLAPWTGFAVECAWAAVALALAFYLLRRRDV
jgi:ABC-type transport system involved in multi-copper enzyme maturation permease subunit